MVMSEEQTRRLMELLGKLVARDAGAHPPDTETKLFSMPEFNGQEHNDAKTLYSLGWIRSLRFGGDVMNSWSGEGIYAFDLTEDGKAAIANWELGQVANADAAGVGEEFVQRSRPLVMMVHGSKDGQVPPIIEEIRLWCFERGLDAFKAADLSQCWTVCQREGEQHHRQRRLLRRGAYRRRRVGIWQVPRSTEHNDGNGPGARSEPQPGVRVRTRER